MKDNEFVCAVCEEIYTKDWTEEEAQMEYKKNFPEAIGVEQAVVCDDCYKRFMEWHLGNSSLRS